MAVIEEAADAHYYHIAAGKGLMANRLAMGRDPQRLRRMLVFKD